MAPLPESAVGVMNAYILGSLIIAVPGIAIAWAALWKRNRPVFWLALALILVGTGYLNATGATRDIGMRFSGTAAPVGAPAR